MSQRHVTAEQAFEVLREASMRYNRKAFFKQIRRSALAQCQLSVRLTDADGHTIRRPPGSWAREDARARRRRALRSHTKACEGLCHHPGGPATLRPTARASVPFPVLRRREVCGRAAAVSRCRPASGVPSGMPDHTAAADPQRPPSLRGHGRGGPLICGLRADPTTPTPR
nr:ANTAR domain-containing protein [Geodermatophilus africanus]